MCLYYSKVLLYDMGLYNMHYSCRVSATSSKLPVIITQVHRNMFIHVSNTGKHSMCLHMFQPYMNKHVSQYIVTY